MQRCYLWQRQLSLHVEMLSLAEIAIFQRICLNWVKKRLKSLFFVLLSTVSYFPLLTQLIIQLLRNRSCICAVVDRQDNWCCVEFIFKMAKRRADVALPEKLEILEDQYCQHAVNVLPLNNSRYLVAAYEIFCTTKRNKGSLNLINIARTSP